MSAQNFYHSLSLNRELLLGFRRGDGYKPFAAGYGAASAKKWVVRPLDSDRRGFAVARINNHIVRQDQQFFADRLQYLLMRSAPKIGASDAPLKQRVTGDEALRSGQLYGCFLHARRTVLSVDSVPYNKTYAARRVSGSVENPGFVAAPA